MFNSSFQVKYGIVVSYVTTILYIVIGIFYTPYLIKQLGNSDYGLYTLLTTLTATLTLDFGISKAQARFIARYLAENKEYMIKNLLGITLKLYLLLDVILLVILLFIYHYADAIFVKLNLCELERFRNILLIGTFFLIFTFPLLPIGGIFVAYEKIVQLKFFDLVYKIVSVLVLVLVLYLKLGLYVLVISSLSIHLLFQFVKLFYLYKKLKIRISIHSRDKLILNELWRFSAWETVRMIASQLMLSLIPSLLAIVSNTNEIALFAVVITLLSSIQQIATALNSVFLPKVMKLVVGNATGETYTNLMIKVGRLNLYVIGCILVGLFCFGQEFFTYWLPPEYRDAFFALLVVSIPLFFHPTQIIANELFYAKNQVKYWAILNVLGSIICVLGVLFFAQNWGAMGAALGLCLSYILAFNVCANILYHRLFKIKVWSFFKECQGRILPILGITWLGGYALQHLWLTNNLLDFLLKICLWGGFYVITIYLMSFNKEEKGILYSILRLK